MTSYARSAASVNKTNREPLWPKKVKGPDVGSYNFSKAVTFVKLKHP